MLPAVYRRNKRNQQPITLTRNTSASIGVTLTDLEGETYVLNENETLRFGIKMRPESDAVQVLKIIDSSALDPEAGVYYFNLTPADTAELRLGNLWYDIVLQTGEDMYPVVDLSPVTVLATAGGES